MYYVYRSMSIFLNVAAPNVHYTYGPTLSLLVALPIWLLLTLFIPITLLIGLSLLPFGDLGEHRVDRIVPMVMMTAVMSTAFTGQAIAVGARKSKRLNSSH